MNGASGMNPGRLEEERHRLDVNARKRAVLLDYKIQLLEHRRDNAREQLNAAGGTRPAQVQWANLLRGLLLSALGIAVIYAHFELGKWALEWLQLGNKTALAAMAVSVSGAAGAGLLLGGILRIFTQRRHDAHTICITFVAAAILVGSIACSAKLGYIRARRAALESASAGSTEVMIDGSPVRVEEGADPVMRFMKDSGKALVFIFPLMAVVFDLSSGVLLHVGFDKVISSLLALLLLGRIRRIDGILVTLYGKRDTLQHEAEGDFLKRKRHLEIEAERRQAHAEKQAYRATPEYRNRKIAFALATFMIAMIVALVLASTSWSDVVVGIDLSLSGKKTNVAGMGPLDANKKVVERVIRNLAAGERISVLGITARSRADPWMIFSARTGEKPGYFGERLKRDRALIAAVWRKRSRKVRLFAKETDILGFFDVAAELLHGSGSRRIYVLSDAMNCTAELNLEKPPKKAKGYIWRLKRMTALPDLSNVSVYWLGAGGPGTGTGHFRALRAFWKGYIERCGGTLKQFTGLREVR